MSAVPRTVTKQHPYAAWNDTYKKFQPTQFELPAYSADCVPFRWMLREFAVEIADDLQLPYQAELEEAVDQEAGLHGPAWVQHADNQRLLLETFFSAVVPEKTLCFFYAKGTPLSDDPRRILIGVGRISSIANVVPYHQNDSGFGSVLWERVVRHTIRPTLEDGFLLPYHTLLDVCAADGSDPAEFTVHVPQEYTSQFSYATEHVSHDAALELLLALDGAVDKISTRVPGDWQLARTWLSERLGEVWKARGPFPGLGAALKAFGVSDGILMGYAVQARVGENADPWPVVDEWMRDPAKAAGKFAVGKVLSRTWEALSPERLALLKLVARFAMTTEQATRFFQETERVKAGLDATDAALLANPYALYELDRLSRDPLTVASIDRGVFPEDAVRSAHPLPAPSALEEAVDERRVRALIVDVLESSAADGDALRSRGQVIQAVRDAPLQPDCLLSVDVMNVIENSLAPEVVLVEMANKEPAYQLLRLNKAREAISKAVTKRAKGARLNVTADWRVLIDQHLPEVSSPDADEELARSEKAAALETLATSRISVLIGAAGTGKTTLLRALSKLPEVADGGILLLAPTGKARVRMQEAIGHEAQTLAQLLVRSKRYLGEVGRYCRSDHDRTSGYRTVIVDECSMLTEEALDALLDGIEGYDRLILVGDPRQLPPIGVGRPFIDITTYLRGLAGVLSFPRVAPSYAELTIPRRQVGLEGTSSERWDLLLAEWFSGGDPTPGADEVWDRLGKGETLGSVSARSWTTTSELHAIVKDELASGLAQMQGPDDSRGFQLACGGSANGEYVYFNRGAAKVAEGWQVLSPVRVSAGGVVELNRLLQQAYRGDAIQLAENGHSIPKPAGPERIVYGDKVINVRNKSRKNYWPKSDDVIEYVANGEIGVVVGPFRGRGKKVPLNKLTVEFSTQQGTGYDFWKSELGGDDGDSILELAYAITIHKAQGSEFGRTFVVIPNPCRLLSRELIYTALTRQQDHVVLLHQGDLAELRQFASVVYSESASRLTNLFANPDPVEVDGKFLEAGLIHKTRKGIAVRSKSEVIIADLLYSKNIEFTYEQPLHAPDGSWRSPDFTIQDDASGVTYYWEHLGMLQRPSYKKKWEQKLAWYKAHGVLPHSDGGGPVGTLLTTEDAPDGSISSADIETLVDQLL